MTDRTPPQEREREARSEVIIEMGAWTLAACEAEEEGGDWFRSPKREELRLRIESALDALTAAVAARVRAEMRERVEGMRIDSCGISGSAVHRYGVKRHNEIVDAVLAARAEETTG